MARREVARVVLRVLLGLVYLAAGVAHLRSPGVFLSITPAWVPWPEFVIAATGVAEVLGAVALVGVKPLRRAAAIGWRCMRYVSIRPTSSMRWTPSRAHGADAWWPYHAPRLAFQPVFVWWALFAGGVIDWPLRRRPAVATGG